MRSEHNHAVCHILEDILAIYRNKMAMHICTHGVITFFILLIPFSLYLSHACVRAMPFSKLKDLQTHLALQHLTLPPEYKIVDPENASQVGVESHHGF